MTSPPPLVNFSKPPPNLKIKTSLPVSNMATPAFHQSLYPLNNNNLQQPQPVYPLNQHYQQQPILPQLTDVNNHLIATAGNQPQVQQYYIVSSPNQPLTGCQDNQQTNIPSAQDPSGYQNVAIQQQNGQILLASGSNQQNYVVQSTNHVHSHWNGQILYESINQTIHSNKSNQNLNPTQIYTPSNQPQINLISMPRSDNHENYAHPQYQILQVVTAPPDVQHNHQPPLQPLQSQHLIQTDAISSSQGLLIQNSKQPTISSIEYSQSSLPAGAASGGANGTTIPVHMKVQSPDGTFQFVPCLLYYPLAGS